MITGAAKVAGVVGWPVAHSLSPLIHNAWIDALGLDAAYVPFAVPPEHFETFVRGLSRSTLTGLNITIPHKRAAVGVADTAILAAADAGAGNVLLFDAGRVTAMSTDGMGLAVAIEERQSGFDYRSGPAVVIGSGGAALAALHELDMCGCPEIRIAVRRPESAAHLGFDHHGVRQTVFGFDMFDQALTGTVLVINATSAELNGAGELPSTAAAPETALFMDMVYTPLRTPFLQAATARGHLTVDGLAMLIGQARPSFQLFFGVAPPPPEVVDVRALCLRALGEA